MSPVPGRRSLRLLAHHAPTRIGPDTLARHRAERVTGTMSLALGFGLALLASLVMTPVARRLALAVGLMDQPRSDRPYKLHSTPVPFLGGAAILVSAAIVTLPTGVWRPLWAAAIGAGILMCIGLLDDLRELPVMPRLALQAVAAGVAMWGGVHASPTGVVPLDLLITFVWLIGVTNALNIIDNCNGITAGLLVIAAGSLSLLALVQGQHTVGVLAAAVAGAALGFLPFNFPKARIFLGDAGTLPLGFLIAVVAVEVNVSIGRPWSFGVPVCILGLPIVNTMVVSVDRIRAGRRIWVGRSDSMWHRLLSAGLSPTRAVLTLLALAASFGAVGVLSGSGILPPTAPMIAFASAGVAGLLLLRIPVAERALEVRSLIDRHLGPLSPVPVETAEEGQVVPDGGMGVPWLDT